jgi:hypothetical protein
LRVGANNNIVKLLTPLNRTCAHTEHGATRHRHKISTIISPQDSNSMFIPISSSTFHRGNAKTTT